MVDRLQREPQKIIPILICTSSLYNMTLHLVPSRGREYFPTSWIWTAWTNRIWWKWWSWLPSLGLKKPFNNCSCLLEVLRWNCKSLRAWKTIWPSYSGWSPPDQPANSQSTTTRYMSEAISNHPAPVKLPVNWSHISDPKWDKKKSHSVVCSQNCIPMELWAQKWLLYYAFKFWSAMQQ